MRGGGLREALSFLTPLSPPAATLSPKAAAYFPLAGAVIGSAEGLGWSLARRAAPPRVAGVLTTLVGVALTGALHLDGLADTADGLLSAPQAKDRLEIMAEPAVGSYGAMAVALSLLGRAAALSELSPSPALLAGLACGSRSVMVLAASWLPYARREGLGAAIVPEPAARRKITLAGGGGLAAGALLARLGHERGLHAFLAGLAAAGACLELARRRIGGFTGDVLGAAGTLFETVGLMAAAR